MFFFSNPEKKFYKKPKFSQMLPFIVLNEPVSMGSFLGNGSLNLSVLLHEWGHRNYLLRYAPTLNQI